MKKILIILLLALSATSLWGTIYYVATTGSDAAAGSFAAPWETWHYAFNHVTPGDTVYFRGGVYTDLYSSSRGAIIATTTINGTRSQPTSFFAYPDDWAAGNYPILDCSNASYPIPKIIIVRQIIIIPAIPLPGSICINIVHYPPSPRYCADVCLTITICKVVI